MVGLDKVILSGMVFFAHHGLTEAERAVGHTFEVDAKIYVDTAEAAAADDVTKTVDYNQVYQDIEDVIVHNRFHILETLAGALAARILTNQVVEKVVIRVKKVHPPIAGTVGYAAVEVSRKRDELG